jgi:hypothetical protein
MGVVPSIVNSGKIIRGVEDLLKNALKAYSQVAGKSNNRLLNEDLNK